MACGNVVTQISEGSKDKETHTPKGCRVAWSMALG